VAAPTRSVNDHSAFVSRLVPGGGGSSSEADHTVDSAHNDRAEELLSLMEEVLPGADDEVALLNAALKRAAAGGHDHVVSALLQARAHPDSGHTKKDRGDTPLVLAAGAGHTKAAQVLIRAGAAPNLPDASARTATHLAAGGGHVALLRWMLTEGGAASEVKDVNKWTPQHFAAWHGRTEVLDVLLRLKAAQSLALAHERRGRTSGELSEQALQQELDSLRHDEHALLARAVHLVPDGELDKQGPVIAMKPLAKAVLAAEESLGSIKEWAAGRVQSGVRRDWSFVLDARDRWHRTPLSWALFQNHASSAQLLIDGGAQLDWTNPYAMKKLIRNNNLWNTSLHLAVQAGSVNVNDPGATSLPTGESADTAHDAHQYSVGVVTESEHDRFGALRVLLQHPEVLTKLDAADNEGRTALHEAAALVLQADIERVAAGESAASDGRDVKLVGQIENLMTQAVCAVRLLLDAKATVNATDNAGRTALHVAVQAGQTAAVRLLVAAGADTNALDGNGCLPGDAHKASTSAQAATAAAVIGRRARRDGGGSIAGAPAGEQGPASKDRHERRAHIHELEPKLRKVLETYAAEEPLVASVLGARFEKVWGEALKPKDWGYNKMSTLLRALPELCEVSTTQPKNSASAPTLLVRLNCKAACGADAPEPEASSDAPSGAAAGVAAAKGNDSANTSEDWPFQEKFRHQAATLVLASQSL
jgi:ankyrin repeat protein